MILTAEDAVGGGTSTNPDGRFSLRVEALPVELAIRYIGYETQRLDDASTEAALAWRGPSTAGVKRRGGCPVLLFPDPVSTDGLVCSSV